MIKNRIVRIGIIAIITASILIGALYAWVSSERSELLEKGLSADPITSRQAVIDLSAYKGDEVLRDIVRIFKETPDQGTRDAARILLLRENNMMPSIRIPDYVYSLSEPYLDPRGGILLSVDGEVPEWITALYKEALEEQVGLTVRVEKCPISFESCRYDGRMQYEMVSIMEKGMHHIPNKIGRVIVVTDKDTYVRGRNWDTGASASFGPISVVSIKRLNPEFWGDKPDRKVYAERLRKVVVHENAHTLIPCNKHCRRWSCILHKTDSLGDIDKLPFELCFICEALREENLNIIKSGRAPNVREYQE